MVWASPLFNPESATATETPAPVQPNSAMRVCPGGPSPATILAANSSTNFMGRSGSIQRTAED
jgi:hypothetical protein